jgi:phosphoribosylformylglycinamidine synthase
MTVAESALNVACAGARPAALVNCLNFGSPEHPEVMWQLSESIDGMADACRALDIPVIGGNVSLYNASAGTDIDPTPVVAVLGVIDRLERRPPGMAFSSGSSLVVLGETDPSLAGSRWAVERHGHRGGTLPALDLAAHARLLALMTRLVPVEDLLTSVHDISGGGLALALAECAVRSGVGCIVDGVDGIAELFSESPSRVVLGATQPDEVLAQAQAAGVLARVIGTAGGDRIVVAGLLDLAVSEAVEAWRVALPGALGEPVTA